MLLQHWMCEEEWVKSAVFMVDKGVWVAVCESEWVSEWMIVCAKHWEKYFICGYVHLYKSVWWDEWVTCYERMNVSLFSEWVYLSDLWCASAVIGNKKLYLFTLIAQLNHV